MHGYSRAAWCAVILGLALLPVAVAQRLPVARTHVIEITGFEFKPAVLRVQPGDTVIWINRDVVPHTATARTRIWDTGTIAAGDTAALVVRDPGAQSYFCVLHPSMKAQLIH